MFYPLQSPQPSSRPTSCRAAWTWLATYPSTLRGILAIDPIHSTSAAGSGPAVKIPGLNDLFISASPTLPLLRLIGARQILSSASLFYSPDLAFALASPWPSLEHQLRSCCIYPRALSPSNQPMWPRNCVNSRGPPICSWPVSRLSIDL